MWSLTGSLEDEQNSYWAWEVIPRGSAGMSKGKKVESTGSGEQRIGRELKLGIVLVPCCGEP